MLFSKLILFKITIEIKMSTKCFFMKKHGLYICNPYFQLQSQRKVKNVSKSKSNYSSFNFIFILSCQDLMHFDIGTSSYMYPTCSKSCKSKLSLTNYEMGCMQ